VYGVVFIADVMTLQPGVNPPPWPLEEYFDWHLAVMILSTALFLFFGTIAIFSSRVPRKLRIVWIVGLLFGGVITFPWFWYLYVWRSGSIDAKSA
jgi:hypothetical protein